MVAGMFQQGLIKKSSFDSEFVSNGVLTCLTNIIHENEDKTWTIVSANDEAKALFGNNLSQTPSGEMLSLIKAVKQVLSQKEKIVLPRMIVNGTENEFGFSIYKFILTPLRSSKGRAGCAPVPPEAAFPLQQGHAGKPVLPVLHHR